MAVVKKPRLRFRFNPTKFVNAVAYIAEACPGSTKLTICKHLYFADKEHLRRYGRPITGDHYYRLPHGPVPTRGLDMLRKKAEPADNALLEKYVEVANAKVRTRQSANKKVFSKTDLEVLDWVIARYGKLSPAQLRNLSHKERAWREAEDACPMDFALFFDDESQTIKELAEEEQDARDLLGQYAIR
jgi:uncharacterized phage-associated protein